MTLIQGGLDLVNGEMDDRGYPWSMRARKDFVRGVDRKVGMYNDPTYLGFFLMFQPNSPLLNQTDAPGSAHYYLNKVGEKTRVKYLEAFSDIIRDINLNMPWYWQSISGLENVWKFKDMKEPYKGGDDSKITISTLESIDLKIVQLVELYRRIVYDLNYRREILPYNLRKFTLWIWVQEIRKFQLDYSLLSKAQGIAGAFGYNSDTLDKLTGFVDKNVIDTAKVVNENSAWMLFQLDQCEIVTDESNPFLATLSFAEPSPASNSLVISYENVKYDFGPNLGTDLAARLNVLDEEGETFKDRMKAKIQETASNAARNVVGQIENIAENAVTGFIMNKYLGNVHGFSLSGAIDSIQQSSVSAITGGLQNRFGNQETQTPGPGMNERIHGPYVENNDEQLSGTDNIHN